MYKEGVSIDTPSFLSYDKEISLTLLYFCTREKIKI